MKHSVLPEHLRNRYRYTPETPTTNPSPALSYWVKGALRKAFGMLNGYFFGGTPDILSAVFFYGFVIFCTTILIAIGTFNVLL